MLRYRARARIWINPRNGRWYLALLQRDLFGVALCLRWGGQGRAASGQASHPIRSRADIRALLRDLKSRRRAHGYALDAYGAERQRPD